MLLATSRMTNNLWKVTETGQAGLDILFSLSFWKCLSSTSSFFKEASWALLLTFVNERRPYSNQIATSLPACTESPKCSPIWVFPSSLCLHACRVHFLSFPQHWLSREGSPIYYLCNRSTCLSLTFSHKKHKATPQFPNEGGGGYFGVKEKDTKQYRKVWKIRPLLSPSPSVKTWAHWCMLIATIKPAHKMCLHMSSDDFFSPRRSRIG